MIRLRWGILIVVAGEKIPLRWGILIVAGGES
jgi:hypothetical protein